MSAPPFWRVILVRRTHVKFGTRSGPFTKVMVNEKRLVQSISFIEVKYFLFLLLRSYANSDAFFWGSRWKVLTLIFSNGSLIGFAQNWQSLSYIAMLKYDEEDCCVKEEARCFWVGFQALAIRVSRSRFDGF